MIRNVLTAFCLSLCLVACGDKDDGPVFPEWQVKLPATDITQTVTGKVIYKGSATKPQEIGLCQGNGVPVYDQSIRVGSNGGLRDVLVWVKSGLEEYRFPLAKEEAVIDQKDCVFVPHVLALRTHQPMRIKNSDTIFHNVNFGSRKGQSFVTTIMPKENTVHQVRKDEVGMSVTCDVHAYMVMYVHAIPHPFFAVSSEDGAFNLKDLPAGDYVIEAVHPQLGKSEQKLTIKEGAEAPSLMFEFSKN